MGHLEPCAAAAGLASLVATPVLGGTVGVNAQLRRSTACSSPEVVLQASILCLQVEYARRVPFALFRSFWGFLSAPGVHFMTRFMFVA